MECFEFNERCYESNNAENHCTLCFQENLLYITVGPQLWKYLPCPFCLLKTRCVSDLGICGTWENTVNFWSRAVAQLVSGLSMWGRLWSFTSLLFFMWRTLCVLWMLQGGRRILSKSLNLCWNMPSSFAISLNTRHSQPTQKLEMTKVLGFHITENSAARNNICQFCGGFFFPTFRLFILTIAMKH